MANHWPGTALLCGALAVLGACGDDDSSDDDDKWPSDAGGDAGPKADGGGPPIDGGGGTIDGGKPDGGPGPGPDASAAIAAALDRTGINVSSERADIVFPLACQNAVVCKQETNATVCVTGTRSSYDQYVSKGFSDPCLDSVLDFYSCFATAQCANFDSECGPLYEKQLAICPKDAGI